MGDLSKNFNSSEFACRDCGQTKIDAGLVECLEDLRRIAGGLPIVILDGYRCPEHNKSVGGVGKSQHLLGTAVDVRIPGLDLQQMYDAAVRVAAFCYGGIGVYSEGTMHLDIRDHQARWARVDGKYLPITALVKV